MWKQTSKKDLSSQLNKGIDHMALLNQMFSSVGPIIIDLTKVPESMSIVFQHVEEKEVKRQPRKIVFLVIYILMLSIFLYWLFKMFKDSLSGLPQEQVFINFVPPTLKSTL